MRGIVRFALIGWWLSGLAFPVRGQAPVSPDSTEQANVAAALALTRTCAGDYEMTAGGVRLTLEPQPLLQWSNPEQGQIYGNVFLWTDQGRPVVIGSLFKWYAPFTHMSHEFQSLSGVEVAGRYRGAEVWHAAAAGLAFQKLPESPVVAESAATRLLQMRQLARRFSASAVDRDGNRRELRLLPKPVYRYAAQPKSSSALDGGLFVFVQGTDPEVWLQLEARSVANEPPHWEYALARMNSVELAAALDGREVWRRELFPSSAIYSHREPYTSFMFKNP